MKIVRFSKNGETGYAKLDSDKVIPFAGDPFQDLSLADIAYELDQVQLRPPVVPPNVIAIGLNYRQHAKESGSQLPERPVIFLKATSSIVGAGDKIELPAMAPDKVDYEAELAVVIGKKAKNISVEEVPDYILGYTCANDVSARDCQLELDEQWARAKSFDTFCPLGPWIETELDPDSCRIQSRLNGVVMQDSTTADMIFNTFELISYCSRNLTLYPGTVILTGTPEGVGFARKPPVFLQSGDRIEIVIEGIGTLDNRVTAEKT